MTDEPSRCPDCNKLSFACDCPTYDEEPSMTDPINPAHYHGARWQCIDIIEAHGLDHFRATALAYILRSQRKGGDEDLRKAVWYLRRLAGSPLNLANASFSVVCDPGVAKAMHYNAVADDFAIADPLLRTALMHILPDQGEFESQLTIREDALAAAIAIEEYLGDDEGQQP